MEQLSVRKNQVRKSKLPIQMLRSLFPKALSDSFSALQVVSIAENDFGMVIEMSRM